MTETADQPVTLEELRRITAEIRKNCTPQGSKWLMVALDASMMAQLSPDALVDALIGLRDEVAGQAQHQVRVVFVPTPPVMPPRHDCLQVEVQAHDTDAALLELAEVIHGTLEAWRSDG